MEFSINRLAAVGIISFFSVSTSLGYYYGRIQTPDWNDPLAVTKLIYSRHSVCKFTTALNYFSVRRIKGSNGTFYERLLIKDPPIRLSLRVGDKEYTYLSNNSDEVASIYMDPAEIAKIPLPKINSRDDQEKFLISVGALVVPSVTAVLKPIKFLRHARGKWFIILAVPSAFVGAGAAWGYSMGYKPDAVPSAERLKSELMDPERWRALVKHYRTKGVSGLQDCL